MKKLFIVLAVASLGFVACNNEASTETNTEDPLRIADSLHREDSIEQAQAQQMPDTTQHGDTTAPKDTTKK